MFLRHPLNTSERISVRNNTFRLTVVTSLCSRLSSSEVRFTQTMAVFGFEPTFGGLGATCDTHFRLVGKRVVDFLLVLIELFARCYG